MRVVFHVVVRAGLASRWRSALVVFFRRYELCHHFRGSSLSSGSTSLCIPRVGGVCSPGGRSASKHVGSCSSLALAPLAQPLPWRCSWSWWENMAVDRNGFDAKLKGAFESRLHNLISAVFAELGSFCVDGCPHISVSTCFCVIGMLDSGSVHLEHWFERCVLFSCRLSDVSAIDGAEVFFFAHDTASALASVPSSVDVSNKTLVAFAEIRLVIPLAALCKTVHAAWKSDVTCITCGNAFAVGCPKSSTSWSFSQSNLPKNAPQTASHAFRVPPKLSPIWMARSFYCYALSVRSFDHQ